MSPLVLKMFANATAGEAGSPGSGVARIALQGVKAPNAATLGPNDTIFAAPGVGVVEMNLRGLNDAVFSGFRHGRSYTVTITEEESK